MVSEGLSGQVGAGGQCGLLLVKSARRRLDAGISWDTRRFFKDQLLRDQ